MKRSNFMKKLTKNKLLILLLAAVGIAMFIAAGLTATSSVHASAEATPYAITEQTGLGLGVNVVKAKQANEFVMARSVLNPEQIPQIPTSRITKNTNESYTHSTADIKDLLVDYKLNYSSGGSAGIFLGSLKSELEGSINIQYEKNTYKYYNVLEHKITRYNLSINNYRDPKTYANYFSDNFMSDLAALSSNKNYYEFFNKYGTHIIGSANYGGRLVASCSFASNKIILNSDISLIMENEVNFDVMTDIGTVKTNLARKIGNYFSMNYFLGDLSADFYVKAIGGNSFASGTLSAFKTGYSYWAQSFNGNDSNSVIMDYASDGLVPLWDILPASYSSLGAEMKTAFGNYYNDFKDDMVDIFKVDNTTEFAGGTGAANNPFLIANETHLRNIQKVSMNANYKLKSDINILSSEWVPIGGSFYLNYANTKFDGSFDGNGKKINNLRRTMDIIEDNNRFYFGLFLHIGPQGRVKNLTLDRVAIKMAGPDKFDSGTRVFIGALAGVVRGTVENVTVNGECFYSICTNGSAFVGSIAGSAYKGAVISNCKNNASITAGRYTSAAGGIVGYSAGARIQYCTNTGSVLSRCTRFSGYARAGGIVGLKYNGNDGINVTEIISCNNSVTPVSNCYGGGKTKRCFIGTMFGGETKDVYDTF